LRNRRMLSSLLPESVGRLPPPSEFAGLFRAIRLRAEDHSRVGWGGPAGAVKVRLDPKKSPGLQGAKSDPIASRRRADRRTAKAFFRERPNPLAHPASGNADTLALRRASAEIRRARAPASGRTGIRVRIGARVLTANVSLRSAPPDRFRPGPRRR